MISPQMNQAASCPTKTTAWQTTGNTAGVAVAWSARDLDQSDALGGGRGDVRHDGLFHDTGNLSPATEFIARVKTRASGRNSKKRMMKTSKIETVREREY